MASATDTEADNLPWYRSRRDLGVGALALLMFSAAMHLGGAGMYSVVVGSTLALVALAIVGFSPRQHRRDWLVWSALVFIAVTSLQLLPLPPALLRVVDSQNADWSARALMPFLEDRSTQWRALHADPGNGYNDLLYAVGLLAAYLTAARVARRGRGQDLVLAAAVMPVLIALIGFGHKLGDIDRVFGFYTPFDTSPPPLVSPIINQNHLSAYLGIGAVLCLALATQAEKAPQQLGFAAAALLCVIGSTMSFSRAGIASTAGALVMAASWLSARARPRRKGVSRQRHARAAMVTAALGGAAIVLIAYFSVDLLSISQVRNDTTKLSYIRAAARVVMAHPIIGTGSGSCYSVLVADGREAGVFTAERAESLPIDLALAIGPLFALVVCALAVRGIWASRPVRKAPAWVIGAYCALIAAVVHDLLDFSLWLGATGYLTAVIAGVLAGESSRDEKEPLPENSRPWVARVAIALVAAVVALSGSRSSQWSNFVERARVRSLVESNEPAFDRLRAAMVRHPADAYLSILGARHALQKNDRRVGRFINQAMWLAPRWPAPHDLIAALLARQGRREQALIEVRLSLEESVGGSMFLARLLLALNVTLEELRRTIPTGAKGDAALRSFSSTRLAELSDRLLQERSPNDVDALLRVAARVERTPNGAARAKELYQRILQSQPHNAAAARQLSLLLLTEGQIDQAETVIQRAMQHTQAPALFELLARVHAQRGNAEPMRRAMQHWIDAVGGDFDERSRVLGILGELELGLRNYGAAYTAFEQGDLAAGETHPFLGRIVEVARQSGDVPRWRGACTRLRELTATDDARRAACDQAPTPSGPE